MRNEIRFTLVSKQRPKLAQEIGKILGTAPHYERVPSCAYDIAGYRLDKEGVLHIPEGVAVEMVEHSIRQLRECGFQDDAEFTEEVPMQQDKLTIAVPRASLTDTALENLQKIIANMKYILDTTKTDAGTRKLPITQDVADCFRAILEDRKKPKYEKMIKGHTGFLFLDKNGNPEVAMHWQHRLNHMVKHYNDIYRVQMPNITPHVCRHTYCSNMAKSGMNPKTLQYLMGHSDISVTMNTYTHWGLEDAADELRKMEDVEKVRREMEKGQEKPMNQKMFRAI